MDRAAARRLMLAANAVVLTGEGARAREGERMELQAAVDALPGDGLPAPLRALRDRATALLDGSGTVAELRAGLAVYVGHALDQARQEDRTAWSPSAGPASSVAITGDLFGGMDA